MVGADQMRWMIGPSGDMVKSMGGPPDHYIAEGMVDDKWREVLEFEARSTQTAIPASEAEGVQAWRLRAANEHGIGKPSEEVPVPDASDHSGDE